MVTAEEFSRSLRGAAGFLNREPDALARFDTGEPAFWRSFQAVALTIPAYVVELACLRAAIGQPAEPDLFGDAGLAVLAGLGHLLAFLALPVAMAPLSRRLGLSARYVPFVIVTNWIAVFASYLLALPGGLLLLGLETPALTRLFAVAFGAIVVFVQWQASRATLGLDRTSAAAVTGLGLLLGTASATLTQSLAVALAG